MKTLTKQMMLTIVLMLLAPACSKVRSGERETTLNPGSNSDATQHISAAQLRQRYEVAGSEQEKRAVCLQAIDEGFIQRDGPVTSLDSIFGTNLSESREMDKHNWTVVHFGAEIRGTPDRAGGWTGWYLAVEYFQDGTIETYHLTNLHK
jgi:hypothetical protein